jgi:NAD(P)-dependent dehydrogenase (short-subunit alcohol dehydrogenase family)
MAAIDAFGYAGKRVLVVGGASGIGAATAQLVGELGAEVVVADFTDVPFECAQTISLDLRDPASVVAAVDAVGGPVDALFSCAGISSGDDVMLVNVVGQRDLIQRCLDGGLLGRGSAIAMIASGAGLGWMQHRDEIMELLETADFAAGAAWVDAHGELNNYAFSKEVVIAYCFQQAFSLIQRGIRINALCPSSTDTPLARRSFGWLEYGTDYREATGIDVATPREQAHALAFLCSQAASYVSGAFLSVDAGVNASRTMGTFVPAPPSMAAASD